MDDVPEDAASINVPSSTPSRGQRRTARRNVLIGATIAAAVLFGGVANVLIFVVLNGRDSRQQNVDMPSIERDLERQIDLKVGQMVGERVAGTRVVCPTDIDC